MVTGLSITLEGHRVDRELVTGRCILVWMHRGSFPDEVPKLRPEGYPNPVFRAEWPAGTKALSCALGRRPAPVQQHEGEADAGWSVLCTPHPKIIIDLFKFRLHIQKTSSKSKYSHSLVFLLGGCVCGGNQTFWSFWPFLRCRLCCVSCANSRVRKTDRRVNLQLF